MLPIDPMQHVNPLGDPLADPLPPFNTEAQAFGRLKEYFTGKGPSRTAEIPWPLKPEHVINYIVQRCEQETWTVAEAARLPALVNLYLLEDLPRVLVEKWQPTNKTDEQVCASAGVVCAAGFACDAKQLDSFIPRYEALVGHPDNGDAMRSLVLARDALGPTATSATLRAAIAQHVQKLAASDDFADQIESRDLEDIKNNELADIDGADEARKRIFREADPQKRLALLLELYFERTEDDGLLYLMPWTVREIRKHARDHGRDGVIVAFQKELQSARKTREDDDEMKFVSLRAMNALIYFGVELKGEDDDFHDEYASEQQDPLSMQQLMPQPHEHAPEEDAHDEEPEDEH